MKNIFFCAFVLWISNGFSQTEIKKDSVIHLKEVIVKGLKTSDLKRNSLENHSVEKFLQRSKNISLIRRGVYGAEPVLNNMFSERSVITIDGARIFGACTDKMDSATSYLELQNLSDICVSSGQHGSTYGTTIAGNIDLKPRKVHFSQGKSWKNSLKLQANSNNLERFSVINSAFSNSKWGANASVSYRKAGNYQDGNRQIVKYSQYEKINTSLNIGLKINDLETLRANFIYDFAQNIGYPSLPMDVSLAKALISMLTYTKYFENQWVSSLEMKLYYNQIAHQMDDSFREQGDKLPIKMEMPGESETWGAISKIQWGKQKIYLNFFQNFSSAKMRMYYQSGERMFAYTWPDVLTQNAHISSENHFEIADNQNVTLHTNIGWQYHFIRSEVGYNLNRVFHQFERQKWRFLPSFSLLYRLNFSRWNATASVGWGQRSPSVSEAYGFYLFNNSDGYDYIGNPNLPNETSLETQLSLEYHSNQWKTNLKAAYFFLKNYIFGQPFGEPTWQMTPLGAEKKGLKMYQSLPEARQLNITAEVRYDFSQNWHLKNAVGYAYGTDYQGNPLAFMRPFYYAFSVGFEKNNFRFLADFHGDFKQNRFSKSYGESPTPAYHLLDVSAEYRWKIKSYLLDFELSTENLFNAQYTTYSNWNKLPQMGRNIFFGVTYHF